MPMSVSMRLKHQQRIGRRPADLTANQLKADELRAQSWVERARMVSSALQSVARTRLLNEVVPSAIAAKNQRVCEACPSGHFYRSKDGHPYCSECGCSGHTMMKAKWSDPTMACPKGHWDNTIVDLTVEGCCGGRCEGGCKHGR